MGNGLKCHPLNNWLPEKRGGGLNCKETQGNSLGCLKCPISSLRWWLHGGNPLGKLQAIHLNCAHLIIYNFMPR